MNSDGILEGTWDIIVNGDGITGINDLHLDKGVIYKVSPNPFLDTVAIRYGAFRPAKVNLLVYNMQGQLFPSKSTAPKSKICMSMKS